nr:hypothetical protein GCM10020092_024790 [Actinoplanes digitatis]
MGAAPIALFAVALYRPTRVAVGVAAVHAVSLAGVYLIALGPTRVYWESVTFMVLLDVIVVAIAMLVRSQRQLVRSFAERARQAEQGQQLRLEQARLGERERIAREMHDVLAHRISLLAVHAGALEVRREAPEGERAAAGVIRQSAYEALEDLRQVIGMLREPADDRPQPTLADVPALIEQSREAGARVELELGAAGPVPAGLGRARVPDRAGGADQRPQARAGRERAGGGHRPRRAGPGRGGRQRPGGRRADAAGRRGRAGRHRRAGAARRRPPRARTDDGRRVPAPGLAAMDALAPVRVLLVDDDALVRAGLTMMLGEFDGIEVAGAVADGTEVAAAVAEHRPDVVLMDIRMPGMDGLTATEALRARRDPPEVIVLTTFDTDAHVLRAMRAGASGFLLKHTPPAEIARAVRRVAAGEPMLSPEVLRRMMSFVAAALAPIRPGTGPGRRCCGSAPASATSRRSWRRAAPIRRSVRPCG